MGVFLGLGDAQLLEALRRNVLADGVGHVLLVEENVQARELGVVRSHATIVERHGVHSLGGHILLRQHDRQLLGAVVAVVEEDHQIVRADRADGLSVLVDMHDGLDELVRHALVIGFLHGSDHIRRMFADAVHQRVVSHLHALPAFVAVHGVVTADHRRHLARRCGHVLFEVGDESLAAVRVGVAAVHKAMHEGILDLILGGDVAELEKVLQRRVHAAVRHETHEMHVHAVLFGVFERGLHLGILHDRVVAAGAVDLHEVLIDDATGADIEVANLRIAHLSVGQTDVLTVGAQFGMGVFRGHGRDVFGMDGRNHVRLVMTAVSPAVEDH